jgi:membrane protease YdiL (CAAX protease family)
VNWLVGLAVIVGAPLAEELLFRGFLLPALTKTRRGFWGAAVVTTIGWTALHFYSIAGLIEVFMIGVYFAWLVRRYGTLWLPMALHALYNGLQFAVLAWWPT